MYSDGILPTFSQLQVYTSLAVTDGDVTTTYTKANPPTIGQEITAKTRNLKIKFVALFLNSKNKFRIKIDRSASGS